MANICLVETILDNVNIGLTGTLRWEWNPEVFWVKSGCNVASLVIQRLRIHLARQWMPCGPDPGSSLRPWSHQAPCTKKLLSLCPAAASAGPRHTLQPCWPRSWSPGPHKGSYCSETPSDHTVRHSPQSPQLRKPTCADPLQPKCKVK